MFKIKDKNLVEKNNKKKIIEDISHIGFTTSCLESSLNFFCNTFKIKNSFSQYSDQEYLSKVTGLKNCKLKIGFLKIDEDDLVLEVIEYIHPKESKSSKDPRNKRAPHICWQVDNIDYFRESLSKAGVKVLCFNRVISSRHWKGFKTLFIYGPDNILIELCESRGNKTVKKDKGKLLKMHHISIPVNDLEYIIDLMSDKFGLELITNSQKKIKQVKKLGKNEHNVGKAAYVKIPNNEFVIEFYENQDIINKINPNDINNIGSFHLCFKVQDINYVYKVLSQNHIDFVGPPAEITEGINKGSYAIYLDLDEVKIELFQGLQTKV